MKRLSNEIEHDQEVGKRFLITEVQSECLLF